MSLRDRLICFADFVGMTLLALRFLLPLSNCFLKVCLPTPVVEVAAEVTGGGGGRPYVLR